MQIYLLNFSRNCTFKKKKKKSVKYPAVLRVSREKSPRRFFRWFWDFLKEDKVFLPVFVLQSFILNCFSKSPMCWSPPPPHQLDDSASPTYRQTEICADTWEEFEQIYIRVNTYRKNKNTSKIK